MNECILVINIINLILLIVYGVVYFINNYTIISLELYNKMADIVDEYATQLKDHPPEELSGGVGFCVDTTEEEE